MKKSLITLVALTSILSANNIHNQTNKTTCIQQSEHSDKTLDLQKKVIIEQAKQEALEELYGTLIFSSTDIQDGKLTSDQIKSRAVGSVRVKGNPSFYNGKNLGEICGDVHVYITKEDLAKYSPKKVQLNKYCFNDTTVQMGDIQNKAREAAYKEMLVQYKPSLKSLSFKQAESLIHGFKESNAKFDFSTKSYCFDAVGTILPYELEMGGDTQAGSNSGAVAKKQTAGVTDKYGNTYKEIKSPYTGKTWLDRNLGAKVACDSLFNKDCFGDLFQWGRGADGHEKRDSEIVDTNVAGKKTVTPKHSKFIKTTSGSWYDPNVETIDALWQGVDGLNNPCPSGYRVPTIDELFAETKDAGYFNLKDMTKNFLKIPVSDNRDGYWGSVRENKTDIFLYTSSLFNNWGTKDNAFVFRVKGHAIEKDATKTATANAQPVRCIKN